MLWENSQVCHKKRLVNSRVEGLQGKENEISCTCMFITYMIRLYDKSTYLFVNFCLILLMWIKLCLETTKNLHPCKLEREAKF